MAIVSEYLNRQRVNRHHLLHSRVQWTSSSDAEALREQRSLIVPMDRTVHAELHRQTTTVPLLGYFALNRVLRDYAPQDTHLRSIDALQQAIDKASEHPKAHYVERDLGELACHVLDLQKDFVRQGEVFVPEESRTTIIV